MAIDGVRQRNQKNQQGERPSGTGTLEKSQAQLRDRCQVLPLVCSVVLKEHPGGQYQIF